ncbi:MAG: hypothetical protein ACE147_06840 [Candidatus Methylomirabilales bacterium]
MRLDWTPSRGLLLLCLAVAPGLLATPSLAEQSFSMQAPPPPAFTYRVAPNNQLIKPGPATLRFARSDPGASCEKVVEVGVNAGSQRAYPGGAAPGRGDANAALYTSPVGGGGGLCSFGYQDNAVAFAVPPHVDAGITSTLASTCMASVPFTDPGSSAPRYVPRRQTTTQRSSFAYKVFLRKANGEYEWRAPRPCSDTTPHWCWIEVETICEAIPNRPPQPEAIEVMPDSLPPEGGQVRIRVIAFDDHGVSQARARPSIQGESTVFAPVNLRRASGLGRTPGGENRSQWEGIFTVPPNRIRSARTISFTFDLLDWDNAGTGIAGAGTKRVQQAVGRDFTPPQVLGFQVTPQQMQPYGGDVTLSVKASDNLGISTVTALFRDPNGREVSAPMPLAAGTPTNGEWKVTQALPSNTTSGFLTYAVKATLVDTDGNSVETGLKSVGVNNDSVPPQLLSFTLTPQALPSAGGDVMLTVKASDNSAVQSVTAHYTKPGGAESTMQVPLAGGTPRNGEWRATWREHPNMGSSPLVSSVRVTVRDATSNATNSQPLTITVAPVAAEPARTPPQLLSFTATPAVVADGGEVTISVRAADDQGVKAVTVLLVQPDGRQHPMPLPLVAGTAANGEWRAKWTAAGNKQSRPYTYTIKAAVTDRGDNTVTSQPVTVTVTPRASSAPAGRPGATPAAPSGLR